MESKLVSPSNKTNATFNLETFTHEDMHELFDTHQQLRHEASGLRLALAAKQEILDRWVKLHEQLAAELNEARNTIAHQENTITQLTHQLASSRLQITELETQLHIEGTEGNDGLPWNERLAIEAAPEVSEADKKDTTGSVTMSSTSHKPAASTSTANRQDNDATTEPSPDDHTTPSKRNNKPTKTDDNNPTNTTSNDPERLQQQTSTATDKASPSSVITTEASFPHETQHESHEDEPTTPVAASLTRVEDDHHGSEPTSRTKQLLAMWQQQEAAALAEGSGAGRGKDSEGRVGKFAQEHAPGCRITQAANGKKKNLPTL